MPNTAKWIGTAGRLGALPPAQASTRAAVQVLRTADKSTSVTFEKPDGTEIPAQSVRLEYESGASWVESEAGKAGFRNLVIFGIKDHETLPDTDIQSGYKFWLNGKQYIVRDPMPTHGQIQATAERYG